MRTPAIVGLAVSALLAACSNTSTPSPAAGAPRVESWDGQPTAAEVAKSYFAYRQLSGSPVEAPANIVARHVSDAPAPAVNFSVPLNAVPISVPSNIAASCVYRSEEDYAKVQREAMERKAETAMAHGDNVQGLSAVWIYMNDIALPNRSLKEGVFPVGSVVVKQKTNKAGTANDGVGGMIKRPAGYDPKRGDWEYFYYDSKAGVSSGRLPNCIDCHASAKKTDYVFGGWLR